jgi:ribosomal protein S6
MVREYKAIFIISSKLSEDDTKRFIEQLKETIVQNNGTELINSKVETKALPYPIKKETKGTYFTVEFKSAPEVIKRIKEDLKHRDEILRLTIIRKEK